MIKSKLKVVDITDACELNINEEQRVNIVTKVAAISRGKDKSNNPVLRYSKLLRESAPNFDIETFMKTNGFKTVKPNAGRPLEFAPVKLEVHRGDNNTCYFIESKTGFLAIEKDIFLNDIMPFSYIEDEMLYTNIRALVNAGIPYNAIPYNVVDNYRILKVSAPYFVFAQIRTHSRLSQVAISARVTTTDDYWLPDDILERISNSTTLKSSLPTIFINNKEVIQGKAIFKAKTNDEVIAVLQQLPIFLGINILKHLGYKKEIYNRWPQHLKMTNWIIGGFLNDPKSWGHLILEREVIPEAYSSWVQETTKEVSALILETLNRPYKHSEIG